MKTSYSLLLNAQSHPSPTTIPVTGQAIFTPRIQAARSAQHLLWSIVVEKVTGGPSSGTGLYMAFQGGVRTTKGNVTPPPGVGIGPASSRYNMTDISQQWFTLNAEDHANFLLDGDFPPFLADQTISSGTLLASTSLGDRTISTGRRYPVGTTLNIDSEQLYVVGAPTTADAGVTWVHPIASMGGPSSSDGSDTTTSANLATGAISKAHANGASIHAPKAYFKRVAGGMDQRLLIVPTLVGGTSPQFLITIDVRARG